MIFFCGIVVTYVGSATNYKKAYDEQKRNINSLRLSQQNAEDQLNQYKKDRDEEKARLNRDIESYRAEIQQLTTAKTNAERERDVAKQRALNFEDLVRTHNETLQMNHKIVEEAQLKVTTLESQQTQNKKKIDDLTTEIIECNAKIAQLTQDRKRLAEEKIQIQDQLDKILLTIGETSVTPGSVTASYDDVDIAPPVKNLNIEGLINEVKLEDSLVSLNIGSADGVKKEMIFHVMRDGRFMCDIKIFSIDADLSSGYIERMGEGQPRAGDIAKTNF